MLREVLVAKLHNLVITEANLEYQGSIGLDSAWLEKAGIFPYEKVQVYNITNGERFETYIIPEEKGSRKVSLNGAAARKGSIGDRIIVAVYGLVEAEQIKGWKAKLLVFDGMENNLLEEK